MEGVFLECLPLHDDIPLLVMEPIHRAIRRGNLNLVKSYVERGASLESRDEMGNTCLMLACRKGESNIVEYLLHEGVDVNAQNYANESALHRCLFVQDLKMLLKNKAKMFRNKHGFSPLRTAAVDGKHGVVENLLQQPNISVADKVDALELLGASHRMSGQKVVEYWKRAAILRSQSSNLPRKVTESIAAFSFEKEFVTLEDLDNIVVSPSYQEKIRMQCIMIYVRLLGATHIYTSAKIYEEVKRNVTSRTINQKLALLSFLVEEESAYFSGPALIQSDPLWVLLDYLLETSDEPISYKLVLKLYRLVVERFAKYLIQRVIGPVVQAEMEQQNRSIELLLDVLRWLVQHLEASKEKELTKITTALVELQLKGRHGKNVVQIAIRNASPPAYRRCQMPSWKSWNACIFYLLACGANPNSVDSDGNNSIHTLVSFLHLIRHKHQFETTFLMLLEHGSHLDAVNYKGATCQSIASTKGVTIQVESVKYTTLQCLACRVIRSHGLDGHILPSALERMVAMH